MTLLRERGGRAVQSRTGQAFIKQAMRDANAVYGGEMSAHHYFRDFAFCDRGMIPCLLIAELVSSRGPLRDLVAERRLMFPSSGECNFTFADPWAALSRVQAAFKHRAVLIDEMDGPAIDMGKWRFSLRSSNTEPVVRLNVEARDNAHLVTEGARMIEKVLLV